MPRLTTKELSARTWPDHVRFFSQGNGWDHCGCIAYHGLRAPRDVRLWADKRDWASKVKQPLAEDGRTHGILVYADGEPVGWCQFGAPGAFTYRDDGPDPPWRITCFCTAPAWRGRGVSAVALAAAVRTIARRGGRVIEGRPVAVVPRDDPRSAQVVEWRKRRTQLIGRYGGAHVSEVTRRHMLEAPAATVRVEGVGQVDAWCAPGSQMHHGGTVSMFERAGFEAVGAVRRTNRLGVPGASLVVMRKELRRAPRAAIMRLGPDATRSAKRPRTR